MIESRKRFESRSFARNAGLTVGPIKLITRLIVTIGTRMVSPSDSLELSHPINISPTRIMGTRKGWRTRLPCLRPFRKARKKLQKVRNARSALTN